MTIDEKYLSLEDLEKKDSEITDADEDDEEKEKEKEEEEEEVV